MTPVLPELHDYRPQSEKTRIQRGLQAFAQSPLSGNLFTTIFPAIDRRLMPLVRGQFSILLGQPVVLLHVRGARTGIVRDVPVLATKRGDLLVVVASEAGAAGHPAWYHNLCAHPDLEVTAGGRRRPMRAHIAKGEERDRLWGIACDNYSGYAAYQRRAGKRVIPVVALTPR